MDELSRLEIDLPAIGRNLTEVRRIVGESCGICPVVKADAYGLGARRVVPALEAAGADMLVKGAYSQSRLRQLILGGRTRHILANTTIPVLLAH